MPTKLHTRLVPFNILDIPEALEMVTKITFCGKREIINDCRSEFRAAGKYRDRSPK